MKGQFSPGALPGGLGLRLSLSSSGAQRIAAHAEGALVALELRRLHRARSKDLQVRPVGEKSADPGPTSLRGAASSVSTVGLKRSATRQTHAVAGRSARRRRKLEGEIPLHVSGGLARGLEERREGPCHSDATASSTKARLQEAPSTLSTWPEDSARITSCPCPPVFRFAVSSLVLLERRAQPHCARLTMTRGPCPCSPLLLLVTASPRSFPIKCPTAPTPALNVAAAKRAFTTACQPQRTRRHAAPGGRPGAASAAVACGAQRHLRPRARAR
eukprot:3900245-Rhodomonas_salina.1